MAGRPCLACSHADRAAIDAALVMGAPVASISIQYGISSQALIRHRKAHLPPAALAAGAEAVAAAEGQRGAGLLAEASSLRKKALALLAKAEAAGDFRAALQGVREAARCLELTAKLMGEIDDGATINVLVAPAFITVQAAIVAALAPHPEARRAVLAALEGMRA